jgi:hypothetical protein
MNPVGEGFRISAQELKEFGYRIDKLPPVVKSYLIGRDLVQETKQRFIVDFFGVAPETAEARYPQLWNRTAQLVRPEREKNNRESRRKNWWLFGEPVEKLRNAVRGLPRYIATCRTAKHRIFSMVEASTIPDTKIVAVALSDYGSLAILSSRVHVLWSVRTGGWLGVGNDATYNHLDCFGKFPFPSPTPALAGKLSSLGERLIQHRDARQKEHPGLALTDVYNVLAKLRAGDSLTPEDEAVRRMSLLDALLSLHDDIDTTVLLSYGWPVTLVDDEIIARLLKLNAARAEEESRGVVQWLRPEYQTVGVQLPAGGKEPTKKGPSKRKSLKRTRAPWPSDMPTRIQALTQVLREFRSLSGPEPLSANEVADMFQTAKLDDVELTLQCAAAADAVARIENNDGTIAWMARAT